MIRILIDCPHGQMELSVEEAEKLEADLHKQIAKSRMRGGPLSAFLADKEYVSRSEMHAFFLQFMPQSHVSRRIGRVFGSIVRAQMGRRLGPGGGNIPALPLGIICATCGMPLSNEECRPPFGTFGHRHYQNDWDYHISTSALKDNASAFLPGGLYQLTGKYLESFELMMDNFE